MSARKGFTLIEMLISMGIMAVMTTLAFANFRSAEYGDELRYAAQNLASEIRRAQTFALASRTVLHCGLSSSEAGKFCPSGDDTDCGQGGRCIKDTPRGGYGLSIDSTGDGRTVMFFADTGSANAGLADHRYQEYEKVRQLDFVVGRNVSVSAVDPNDTGILDLVFLAPRPIAWMNGEKDIPKATVTLSHSKTGETRSITVNSISGQISVR